jgi:hypothetical protein
VRVDVGDFRRLAQRNRDAEARLRRRLVTATREAAAPVDREVAASARRHLPARLAAWVAAADVQVRPVTTSNGAGVDITARRTNSRGGAADLAGIDAGTVHHRVYGRGKPVAQSVGAGYWLEVMQGPLARRARQELTQALEDTARGK